MTQVQEQRSNDMRVAAHKGRLPGAWQQEPKALPEVPDMVALQRSLAGPATATPDGILALQEAAGNRAVQRFIVQRHGAEEEAEIQAKAVQGQLREREDVRADAVSVLQRSCGDAASHRAPAVPGNCHEWVLLKKGADDAMIQEFRARGQTGPGASLDNAWYGAHIIRGAVTPVTRDSAKRLAPGTVLVLEPHQNPPHSMILVGQSATESWVHGFNNTGTFGPDAPYLQLDNEPRSLHTPPPALRAATGWASQWTDDGNQFRIASGVAVTIYAVDDATYRANVQGILGGG